jgi:hypothetical protein
LLKPEWKVEKDTTEFGDYVKRITLLQRYPGEDEWEIIGSVDLKKETPENK